MPTPQKHRDVTRFLRGQGWGVIRQGKGSHEVWGDSHGHWIVVPRHTEVSAGVLRQIIRVFPDAVPQNWR